MRNSTYLEVGMVPVTYHIILNGYKRITKQRNAIMLSFASIISSRLSSTATCTLSWALPTLQRSLPVVQTIQFRSVWQEVVRQVPSEDPQRQGQMTFEDVDLADMRIGRAARAEGVFFYVKYCI
jgi:hypothetical protein